MHRILFLGLERHILVRLLLLRSHLSPHFPQLPPYFSEREAWIFLLDPIPHRIAKHDERCRWLLGSALQITRSASNAGAGFERDF